MTDIRLPIGLLFSLLGLIITIEGLLTANDHLLYQKSLGININLWCGLGMLIFGAIMLILSKKKKT